MAVGFGTLAAVLSARSLRNYNYRRRAMSSGVQHRLRNGALWNAADQKLAPLSELWLSTNIDWTDGMGGLKLARVVHLRWPDGSLPVFRTYDRAEVEKLLTALAAFGLRKR